VYTCYGLMFTERIIVDWKTRSVKPDVRAASTPVSGVTAFHSCIRTNADGITRGRARDRGKRPKAERQLRAVTYETRVCVGVCARTYDNDSRVRLSNARNGAAATTLFNTRCPISKRLSRALPP